MLRKHSCQQTQILGSGIQADRALSLQGAESTFNFKPPGIWQLSTSLQCYMKGSEVFNKRSHFRSKHLFLPPFIFRPHVVWWPEAGFWGSSPKIYTKAFVIRGCLSGSLRRPLWSQAGLADKPLRDTASWRTEHSHHGMDRHEQAQTQAVEPRTPSSLCLEDSALG